MGNQNGDGFSLSFIQPHRIHLHKRKSTQMVMLLDFDFSASEEYNEYINAESVLVFVRTSIAIQNDFVGTC